MLAKLGDMFMLRHNADLQKEVASHMEFRKWLTHWSQNSLVLDDDDEIALLGLLQALGLKDEQEDMMIDDVEFSWLDNRIDVPGTFASVTKPTNIIELAKNGNFVKLKEVCHRLPHHEAMKRKLLSNDYAGFEKGRWGMRQQLVYWANHIEDLHNLDQKQALMWFWEHLGMDDYYTTTSAMTQRFIDRIHST